MYSIECRLAENGQGFVAGTDEVGRGPLAGPVVAAAVVLDAKDRIEGLTDSKKLSPKKRDSLFEQITRRARAVAVASIGPRRIERENILRASLNAMALAVERLSIPVSHILIDGNQKIPSNVPQTQVVSGDSKCACIAAASIIAKVVRDRLMERFDRRFPQYGFAGHKGYPTRAHLEALHDYGPCFIHRRTFKGVLENRVD